MSRQVRSGLATSASKKIPAADGAELDVVPKSVLQDLVS